MHRTAIVVVSVATAGTAGVALAGASQHVVPGAYESTPGTGVFLGPLTNSARTYQMLIHESLLTDLVGLQLTGMSFRLPPSATDPWPTAADARYDDYDVYLSGSVAPSMRSLVFEENVAGPRVQVRDGALNIGLGTHPSGGSPNDFGPAIDFNDSAYVYTGGHLLVEIRHTGSDSTSRAVDALTTSASGYGSLFSAAWQSGAGATSGLQGNFAIVQFHAVPAPGAAAMLGIGALAATRRRR